MIPRTEVKVWRINYSFPDFHMQTSARMPIHIHTVHTRSNRKEPLLSHSFNRTNVNMLVGTQEDSEKVVTVAMEEG